MLSKLDGRAWRWLSPAAADGFEPVFSRSWGPDAPSRPGRAAGSCPRWESSKANLIWTRVCSHQYHQLVQAEHSVYPVKYRDTWYLCPLGNPDIAKKSPPYETPPDGGLDPLIGPPTRPASILSARGTRLGAFQVAIGLAGGIISPENPQRSPQEGPCPGLRRRSKRARQRSRRLG